MGRKGETTGRITSLETDCDRGRRHQLCGYGKEGQRLAELEMRRRQCIECILGCFVTQEFFPWGDASGIVQRGNNFRKRFDPSATMMGFFFFK